MGVLDIVEATGVALGIVAVTAFLYPVAANVGNPHFPVFAYLESVGTLLGEPSLLWVVLLAAGLGGIGLAYGIHTDDDE